jgi:hypothetical protein
MKRDRELIQRTRDAQWAALQARNAMNAEVKRLDDARERLWEEVKASFVDRLDAKASTLEGYRELDDYLGGVLGVEEIVRQARERHRNAIRRKDAMDRKRNPLSDTSRFEVALEAEFKSKEQTAELEEEEARLKRTLDAFDPDFLEARRLIENLPEGASMESLRSPSLMANLLDPMLVHASKRLRKYEASTGRSFDEVLANEYQPMVDRLKTVRDRLSLHRRIRGYLDDDDFRFGYDHRSDTKDLNRLMEEKSVEMEIDSAGKALDEIDAVCRTAIIENVRLTIESFDRRFRSAREPVRSDDLDAMAEAGLLDHGAMFAVRHRAGIGMVLDVATACARNHNGKMERLESMLRLAETPVAVRRLTDSLDLVEGNASDAAWFEGVVSDEASRVITGEGLSISDVSRTAVAQKATVLWATAGIARATQDLESRKRGDGMDADAELGFPPPSM